jgi:hypothetical protein
MPGATPGQDVGSHVSNVSLAELRRRSWFRILLHALPVYVMSRLFVMVGAAIVASELGIDRNLGDERGLEVADPHLLAATVSPVRAATDVLTSWDGLWYMSIVRDGYPTVVAPDVTYHMSDARAAFFPLFPMLARALDAVLPGGDTVAVLALNAILGLTVVVLVAMIAEQLYDEKVARTTAILVALFPGSFVLSFAYSEPLMIALAAGCMLCLLDCRWYEAGALAALTTATRPNGLAIVLACIVAVYPAIRDRRDWHALSAVLMAPLGLIAFQIWLGRHTGEAGVWFRVQREAWGEGASFGWTAIANTTDALITPFSSPTDTLTAISVIATVALLIVSWKAKLAWMPTVYSWGIVTLMLLPTTVTARPRFVFTAFPLLIGAAAWYEARDKEDNLWTFVMTSSGVGLTALTAIYGVYGAIP